MGNKGAIGTMPSFTRSSKLRLQQKAVAAYFKAPIKAELVREVSIGQANTQIDPHTEGGTVQV